MRKVALMDQGAVFNIVFAAIASVGGAGAIVAACVRFASKRLSEAMLKKYQAKLEKDIEQYKSELNREAERYKTKLSSLTFVTQRQFDTEFTAYQTLFDSLFEFSAHTANLYPVFDQVPVDENERKEMYRQRYEDYCAAFNRFSETLEKNAPFIPKRNYDIFSNLRTEAYEIACMYLDVRIVDDPDFRTDHHAIARDNYKKTKQFNENVNAAKDAIRDYLTTLKVER